MTDFSRDLVSPGRLNQGDNLFSATRNFKLAMQRDGNLVLYVIDDRTLPEDITAGTYTKAIWASMTNGRGGTHCVMEEQGNLVVYDNSKNILWSSNSSPFDNILGNPKTVVSEGNSGWFLRCQDDGNLVVYAPSGTVLWTSNTYAGPRGDPTTGGGVINYQGPSGGGIPIGPYPPGSTPGGNPTPFPPG